MSNGAGAELKPVLHSTHIVTQAVKGAALHDVVFVACLMSKDHKLPVKFDIGGITATVDQTSYMNMREVVRKVQLEEESRQRVANAAAHQPDFT